jgi:hypothetical protein
MIKLILAVDEAGGIGKDNSMPWPHCSTDLKRFKALTSGHVVVMAVTPGMQKACLSRCLNVLTIF